MGIAPHPVGIEIDSPVFYLSVIIKVEFVPGGLSLLHRSHFAGFKGCIILGHLGSHWKAKIGLWSTVKLISDTEGVIGIQHIVGREHSRHVLSRELLVAIHILHPGVLQVAMLDESFLLRSF